MRKVDSMDNKLKDNIMIGSLILGILVLGIICGNNFL